MKEIKTKEDAERFFKEVRDAGGLLKLKEKLVRERTSWKVFIFGMRI